MTPRPWWVIALVRTSIVVGAGVIAWMVIAPFALMNRQALLGPLSVTNEGQTWLTSPWAIAGTLLGLIYLVALPVVAVGQGWADRWLRMPVRWPQRRPALIYGLSFAVLGVLLVRLGNYAPVVYFGGVCSLGAPWLAKRCTRWVPVIGRVIGQAWRWTAQAVCQLQAAIRSRAG